MISPPDVLMLGRAAAGTSDTQTVDVERVLAEHLPTPLPTLRLDASDRSHAPGMSARTSASATERLAKTEPHPPRATRDRGAQINQLNGSRPRRSCEPFSLCGLRILRQNHPLA
jgi:hypothetical protein